MNPSQEVQKHDLSNHFSKAKKEQFNVINHL